MSRPTYELGVSREGHWWIIDVPALGYRTQARTLNEVEYIGRDVIAIMKDIAAESFDVSIKIEKPADVEAQLEEAARLDHEAQDATARAARDRRAAARKLRETYKLSAIDTATVLGITRARVYQLLDDRDKTVA